MPIGGGFDLSAPVRTVMSGLALALRADHTIAEAMRVLRQHEHDGGIMYFYAVDEEGRLCGVVSTRALLLADPNRRVREEMSARVVSIRATDSLEEALELFAMHRLLALPVVDADNRLLGTVSVQVYADETFELAERQRLQDLFQLIGVTASQDGRHGARRGFRLRMPWLACNIAGGIACAAIASRFEATLQAALILAMFIPLVLTLAESISMQAMTLVLQYIHSPSPPWAALRKRAFTELRTALLLGVACGTIVAVTSFAWGGGGVIARVIGASIAVTMIVSAMIGTAMPVTIRLLRIDPRVAAGPVVLTLTDVTTTGIYLGLAWAVL